MLYTAPEYRVLFGVTRSKIIGIAEKLGIKVIYEAVKSDEIESFDAVFISGISPKVLPVSAVGHAQLDTADIIMRGIMRGYDEIFSESACN